MATDQIVGARFSFLNFFVFRTPLLPADEVVGWADDLSCARAIESGLDANAVEAAWRSDVARLRTRLQGFLDRPQISHAISVASPSLHTGIEHWKRDPDSKKGLQAERALVRYFERTCTRSTPFGLFSGCSIGRIEPQGPAVIELQSCADYRPCTRLDFEYLFALTAELNRAPELRSQLRYWPNSSLHRVGDAWHYVESRLAEGVRSHHLITVEADEYVNRVLDLAATGAPIADMVSSLIRECGSANVSREEAAEYIGELIDNQVLVSSLSPLVTGASPIDDLIQQLAPLPAGQATAETLRMAREKMLEADRKGIGISHREYQAITSCLEALPAKIDPAKLYQIDLIKPVQQAVLSKQVQDEFVRGVEILARLGQARELEEITKFRDAFSARYERAWVPLVDALDEEIGVGFGPFNADGSAPQGGAASGNVPKSHSLLLRKLFEAVRDGKPELELEMRDLPVDDVADRFPDSFTMNGVLVADGPESLANGNLRLVLRGGFGPSGARFFGRFCHADAELDAYVRQQLREEERHHPDAVFAEVVYLPEGRLGNVLCRPALREYEIVYLGRSGAPLEKQLPITDLMVAVGPDGIILRSRKLERRVIPRLSNAHGFMNSKLSSVYRFLCALQHQRGVNVPVFSWGSLETLDRLPRVVCGKIVLAVARWKLSSEEIKSLDSKDRIAAFCTVQEIRRKRGLPRWVLFQEADNTLAVDMDNPLSVDAFVHVLKRGQQAVLLEMYPTPQQLCVRGPEGNFFHELNVPMARPQRTQRKDDSPVGQRERIVEFSRPFRIHPPGGEWLYVKVYGGSATLDAILATQVGPLVRTIFESKAASQWFFIRYADPSPHLRIRFRGAPATLQGDVLAQVSDALQPFLSSGKIWKIQLDTYEREVERYGGQEAMLAAEQIFFADSWADLEIVELLSGDEGLEFRWRAALLSVDSLLSDFGFEGESKLPLLERWRDNSQSRGNAEMKKRLSDRYRKQRATIEALFEPNTLQDSPFATIKGILARRSHSIQDSVREIRGISSAGALTVGLEDLVASYAHMTVNRLLRSSSRQQELNIYDFLHRLYDSRRARSNRGVLNMAL